MHDNRQLQQVTEMKKDWWAEGILQGVLSQRYLSHWLQLQRHTDGSATSYNHTAYDPLENRIHRVAHQVDPGCVN